MKSLSLAFCLFVCLLFQQTALGRSNDHECYRNMAVVRINYLVDFALDFKSYDLAAKHVFKRCGLGGQSVYSLFMGEKSTILSSNLEYLEEVQEWGKRKRYKVMSPIGQFLKSWEVLAEDQLLTYKDFFGNRVLQFPSFDTYEKHKDVTALIKVDPAQLNILIYSRKLRRLLNDDELNSYVTVRRDGYLLTKPLGEELLFGFEVWKTNQ